MVSPSTWTEGYKYQLSVDVTYKTQVYIRQYAGNGFVHWYPDGTVVLKAGYATDGPSGPAMDHPCRKRAADLHDAGYQMLRRGYLPIPGDMSESVYRKAIDDEFLRILKHDAQLVQPKWLTRFPVLARVEQYTLQWTHGVLAYVLWLGVRVFGARYASTKHKRRRFTFP